MILHYFIKLWIMTRGSFLRQKGYGSSGSQVLDARIDLREQQRVLTDNIEQRNRLTSSNEREGRK